MKSTSKFPFETEIDTLIGLITEIVNICLQTALKTKPLQIFFRLWDIYFQIFKWKDPYYNFMKKIYPFYPDLKI